MGVYMEYTDDYYAVANEEGLIVGKGHGNGRNCYQGVGVTYWTEEDGKRLEKDIAFVFENVPESKDWFWGFVPFTYYKGEYDVYVIGCKAEDIIEIDTFDELCQIDPSYKDFKAE
jgi:CTP:phosphocholine cytidylyltransferase-like protein